MTDYNPDPRRPDPYGTQPRYEYTEDRGGRSSFALLALLAIVAVVGGVLYFVEPKPADQQAQVPVPTQTAPMATPGERPALPVTPAPSPTIPAEPTQPRQQ
ncbi:MAG: hypothetical protein WCK95_04115 [Alphaproteobacteria bacterium]|jgi:hypothetical protein